MNASASAAVPRQKPAYGSRSRMTLPAARASWPASAPSLEASAAVGTVQGVQPISRQLHCDGLTPSTASGLPSKRAIQSTPSSAFTLIAPAQRRPSAESVAPDVNLVAHLEQDSVIESRELDASPNADVRHQPVSQHFGPQLVGALLDI